MGAGAAELTETAIAANAWVWTLGGDTLTTSWGANCVGVAGRESSLLVDPLVAPRHARLAAEALRRRTDRPLRMIVLTHHHTDHALGAGCLRGDGVEVAAHRECAARMAAEHPVLVAERRKDPALSGLFDDAEPAPPSLLFDSELREDLGGCPVRIFHPGHNHTPGDAVVHVPSAGIVVCGDLVSNGYHVNDEDANVAALEGGLDRLAALRGRVYVPGHGPPGGPGLLVAQRRYHRAVRESVRTASDGRSAIAAIRARFPGYALEVVLDAAVAAWAP
jgi:cyclase